MNQTGTLHPYRDPDDEWLNAGRAPQFGTPDDEGAFLVAGGGRFAFDV